MIRVLGQYFFVNSKSGKIERQFFFVRLGYMIKRLMTDPSGNQLVLFPSYLNVFPRPEPRETLRFLGKKSNCFPRDQSLSAKYCTLYCNKCLKSKKEKCTFYSYRN